MTANKEPMFWASNPEWFRINPKTDQFELTDKAPERARISFEAWKNPHSTSDDSVLGQSYPNHIATS